MGEDGAGVGISGCDEAGEQLEAVEDGSLLLRIVLLSFSLPPSDEDDEDEDDELFEYDDVDVASCIV